MVVNLPSHPSLSQLISIRAKQPKLSPPLADEYLASSPVQSDTRRSQVPKSRLCRAGISFVKSKIPAWTWVAYTFEKLIDILNEILSVDTFMKSAKRRHESATIRFELLVVSSPNQYGNRFASSRNVGLRAALSIADQSWQTLARVTDRVLDGQWRARMYI